jgi:phage protein D
MFNYLSVTFPNTTLPPTRVYELTLQQNRYQHEVAIIKFRDWGVDYDVVTAGSPIKFSISSYLDVKTFTGYVDHVNLYREPGSNMTEVVALSASYVFKNESQKIYKGLSADAIIQDIASKHNFSAYTVPHPRIYPQVSQAGHTDWEFMVRLAKQSGYSLRTEGTEIYFQPMLYEYTQKRAQAQKFVLRRPADPSGSTLYSFYPTIGENIEYDGDKKSAIAVSGVDLNTATPIAITSQVRNKNTRFSSKSEFFDKYHTHVVALDSEVANHESKAAEDRTIFPYRGTAEIIGSPSIRPDLPIYLDGIGSPYTGFWTVLGTEHRIIEETQNVQRYTTIIHVGTDSLGQSVRGDDGSLILSPDYKASRVIIPGVRQTNIPAKTNLRRTSVAYSPSSNGQFNVANNRGTPAVNSQNLKGPVWSSYKPSASSTPPTNTSTTTFTNRLLGRLPKV